MPSVVVQIDSYRQNPVKRCYEERELTPRCTEVQSIIDDFVQKIALVERIYGSVGSTSQVPFLQSVQSTFGRSRPEKAVEILLLAGPLDLQTAIVERQRRVEGWERPHLRVSQVEVESAEVGSGSRTSIKVRLDRTRKLTVP